jgi:hypothetical protein
LASLAAGSGAPFTAKLQYYNYLLVLNKKGLLAQAFFVGSTRYLILLQAFE